LAAGYNRRGSTAKFPTAGHRPIPKTHIPGNIPNERWRPRYQRSTECFGQCCSTDRITNLWQRAVELRHHRASLLLDRFAFRFLTRLFWLARSPGSI
jgi:hypothetical protein